MVHHVFSCRSLLLSTIILNDAIISGDAFLKISHIRSYDLSLLYVCIIHL